MSRAGAWSEREQRITCTAYAVLLDAQQNDVAANKSQIRRATLLAMNAGSDTPRSAGSYEFKMCNISAALDDSGNTYVTGYKPRSGYQRSLLGILHTLRPDLVNCSECGKFYDDNNAPMCKTCADWVTT